MPHVYILECSDHSYYVGSTRDLERRFQEHASGVGAAYTRHRLPVVLVFAEEYDRVDEAFAREKQIQGWSRAKRQALIERSMNALPSLSGSFYRRRDFDTRPEAATQSTDFDTRPEAATQSTDFDTRPEAATQSTDR